MTGAVDVRKGGQSSSSYKPRTTPYNDNNDDQELRRAAVREVLRAGSLARALGTRRVVKVELKGSDFAVTVFPSGDAGTLCSWCDEPATVGTIDRGHRDYACVAHAQKWLT